MTPDPCCPVCHPITGTASIGFRNYWQWLKGVISVTHRYNQNTLDAYTVADQLRAILQNSPRITTQTQGIIKAYKNINQLIIYRASPLYTSGDIAYFSTVAALLTRGFTQGLDDRDKQNLINRFDVVAITHPLYHILKSIKRAWASSATKRSYSPVPSVTEDTRPAVVPISEPIASTSSSQPNNTEATSSIPKLQAFPQSFFAKFSRPTVLSFISDPPMPPVRTPSTTPIPSPTLATNLFAILFGNLNLEQESSRVHSQIASQTPSRDEETNPSERLQEELKQIAQ